MGRYVRQSLAAQFNLLAILLILATSVGITYHYVGQEKEHRYRDLVNQGLVLASMMAENAEYGIYTEDPQTLHTLLEGIDASPEIVYAVILGRDRNVLFSRKKKESLRIPDVRAPGKAASIGDVAFREYQSGPGGSRYVDILAPVFGIAKSDPEAAFFATDTTREVIGYVQVGLTFDRQAADMRKYLLSTLLVTSILVLLGVGITLLLTRRIASPIRELVDFTRTVSDDMLDRRIAIGGSSEIQELSRSFNHMLSRLKSSRDLVQEQTGELRTVNERLSLLLRSLPIVVYTCEAEGDFAATYISSNVQEVTGYVPEAFLSDPGFWAGNIHPEDAPSVFANLKSLAEKGHHEHEYRWRLADGSYGWFRDSLRIVRSPGGGVSHIVGVWEDISRRKEEAETRAMLNMAVEQAAESILVTDSGGTILYVNPAFERISGYDRDEVLGRNPRILKSGRHDADHYRGLWDALSRGEVWTGNFVNRRKDGQLYQESAVISPVRDAFGRIVHYVAVKRDVTSEVQLEEQLRQSQKMEAVGKLAGGIAHDFNNLLTAIAGYSDILHARLGPGDPGRKEVEEIREAGNRAASLTRQLLAFSRKQMLEVRVVDLNETISAMDSMLRRLIGEDVDMATVPGENLWKVRVDPGQIEQVIMNLAVNARDAMPEGGKLTLETANVLLDEEYTWRHSVVKPGEYVMLSVTDTGCGMDAATQSRIFEPFFTTKEVGKGTGLGLSTVYGIVKQSGGYIWVYSEVGEGTSFKVYLPHVPDPDEAAEKPEKSPKGKERGTETLLLAEDEEVVRELIRTVLGENGYRVLEARDGKEALEIADRHREPIDLLVTDVVMPQMSGRDLAERFAKKHPETRVLFMSGYTENAIVHHGVLDPGTAFLQKPFRMDALARKVREVLDGE